MDCPASCEKGRTCAARRIDGSVRDRDPDQVNERETEADGDAGKARRCAPVHGSMNDQDKHEGKDNFRNEAGK